MMKVYEIAVEGEEGTWSEGLFISREIGLEYLKALFNRKEDLEDIKKEWISEDRFISKLGLSTTYYDLDEREVKE